MCLALQDVSPGAAGCALDLKYAPPGAVECASWGWPVLSGAEVCALYVELHYCRMSSLELKSVPLELKDVPGVEGCAPSGCRVCLGHLNGVSGPLCPLELWGVPPGTAGCPPGDEVWVTPPPPGAEMCPWS